MTAIVVALQFLTIVPLLRRPFTASELGRAVAWFPLVGLGLGALLGGCDRLVALTTLPAPVVPALLLIAWVLLTGALHLDGFMDTCDGLLGGRSPEQRLDIMRDHHVGAFAVVGCVLLLLLKYLLLASLADRMTGLILAAALGRWSMTLAIVLYPYAREEGLGRAMKDHAGWPQLTVASLLTIAVAWHFAEWQGLLVLGVIGLLTLVIARLALLRIPGLTGDLYGTLCEFAETATLLVIVAF